MSGFSGEWLALREAADHRARYDFAAELRGLRADTWHVVDLGCGTGSNLRFLSARLSARQSWICIDVDARLLADLEARSISSDIASLALRCADLSGDVDALLAQACAAAADDAVPLITASALLDLVSAHWLDALAAACARIGVPALLALTYDGHIRLTPNDPDDAIAQASLNAHQRSDKGFGPALGPLAPHYARTAFERREFTVIEQRSDWRLGAGDAALEHELLAGWLVAARQRTGDVRFLRHWEKRRGREIDAGELEIVVGHRDLLALPPQMSCRG